MLLKNVGTIPTVKLAEVFRHRLDVAISRLHFQKCDFYICETERFASGGDGRQRQTVCILIL